MRVPLGAKAKALTRRGGGEAGRRRSQPEIEDAPLPELEPFDHGARVSASVPSSRRPKAGSASLALNSIDITKLLSRWASGVPLGLSGAAAASASRFGAVSASPPIPPDELKSHAPVSECRMKPSNLASRSATYSHSSRKSSAAASKLGKQGMVFARQTLALRVPSGERATSTSMKVARHTNEGIFTDLFVKRRFVPSFRSR
mmetsp:Transcript_54214/g.107111  ORF Transcript_54214/g.107111 Transcript_54214/m.107111 type:complete len:202 (-) Transcript_54214:36-641(-)